jgi:ribonucleoside-diphosphate reductase alpha chain
MSKYYWLNEESRKYLSRGYLEEGQSAEDRIWEIAKEAEKNLGIDGFAEKFEDYLSRGWYSLSSPIWSNFSKSRGLPISCFGSYIGDSMENILGKAAEVGMMTKAGGGTSAFFGDLRGRGSKISSGGESTGSVHFMEIFDKLMNVVSQGNVRRGSFAAYLPVDHPDILEFLRIRDTGHPIQEMSLGVCISDQWMNDLLEKKKENMTVWKKILEKRSSSGYPYLFFSDTVNKNSPQVYKDKGLKINHSNLCNEIYLANSDKESFVCNLSSMNLLHYDEWKDTDAVETLIYFLDAVMTEFINKTEGMAFMEAPRRFAMNQRALGLGVLGWHSLLQSKMISFESMEAKLLNSQVWKNIANKCNKATQELAVLFGEPELLKGYGIRNSTTRAVAPTTSSSFILGQVSPSIEPLNSNYFIKDLAKGKFTFKNPYVKKLLKEKGENSTEVWKSILNHGGSVQHLTFLTQDEKDVFKTFGEISQMEIINQASARQKDIDQGQSINFMIPPETPVKDMSLLLIEAWRKGLKGVYYQRSSNPSQQLARSILNCSSCEA